MKYRTLFILVLLLTPLHTFAHEGGDVAGGFISGFLHPLFGPDHVVAMVAVGLWGGILGRPAIWLLPIAFPLVMAFGGMLGIADVPLPFVEGGIAVSGIILGGLVMTYRKAPLWLATLLVGLFGLFHGYAHGAELPDSATPIAYSVGFVISTGLLHLSGIAIGLVIKWSWGKTLVQVLGAIITLTGLYFLYTLL